MRRALSVVGVLGLVLAACHLGDAKECTLASCAQSDIDIAFSARGVGTYAVDLVIDGVPSRCTTTIPLPTSGERPCTDPKVLLGLSGSMLPSMVPVEDQSIEGLQIRGSNARNISIKITRDGETLHEATFVPTFVTTPGPNGPDCEPASCRLARFTLP